jgi:hypothetical protein
MAASWPLLLVLAWAAAAAPPPNATAPSAKPPAPLHCSSVRHALMTEKGFGEIPREPVSGRSPLRTPPTVRKASGRLEKVLRPVYLAHTGCQFVVYLGGFRV